MLELVSRGKVRETYVDPRNPAQLLVVASDRVSAFDVVLPELVPDKGRVLTATSALAFARLAGHVPTHLVEVAMDVPEPWLGRTLRVRRLAMLPVECVVRGRLVGSAWASYQESGTAFGRSLPSGLAFGDPLPEPLFTPTTKASEGHDLPLDDAGFAEVIGPRAYQVREAALGVFAELARWFAEHDLVLVDAKFEFGLDGDELVLADEVATPDAARIVAGSLGAEPRWLDKQLLRDWLLAQGYDGTGPVPALPAWLIQELRARYVEVYEHLAGQPFAAWPGSSTPYGGEGRSQ